MRLFGKIPAKLGIGVSGDIFSMATLHYFKESKPKVFFVSYDDAASKKAEELVETYCKENKLFLSVDRNTRPKNEGESSFSYRKSIREEFLKNESKQSGLKIVLATLLDDQVERWLATSLTGNPSLYSASESGLIRPLMLNKRVFVEKYVNENHIPYVEVTKKNFIKENIRKELLPVALKINPNLFKAIVWKIHEENGIEEGI